jgi:hypothetical protein
MAFPLNENEGEKAPSLTFPVIGTNAKNCENSQN